MAQVSQAASTSCPFREPPGLTWDTGLADITPFADGCPQSSTLSQPRSWWPQQLVAREAVVRQGSGEPACRGRARGDSGLWDLLRVGRGVGGCLNPPQRPGTTLLGACIPQLWATGCPWAPGTPTIFPNYRASPLASGKLPPAKGPQITLKIDLGVSKELLGWPCGGGWRTCHGRESAPHAALPQAGA